MQRIHDNGHTYKGIYEGWYCPRCADFKTENEVGPDQTCPIHKIPLDREREENWFFRLSAFQEPLEQLYRDQPGVRAAARPVQRGASRSSPAASTTSASAARRSAGASRCRGTPSHVFYVWFDALLNYYTALSFARDGEDLTDRVLAGASTSSARTS